MKRWSAVLAIALVLTGIALSAMADPIEVGGSFTSSASSTRGPAVYMGKGNPQGVPFGIPQTVTLCSPIEVGGS